MTDADYTIYRLVTLNPDHEEFVRALGHKPGEIFYLSDALDEHAPAILEWTEDQQDALRMTLSSAKVILTHIERIQSSNPFYSHFIDPPEHQADA